VTGNSLPPSPQPSDAGLLYRLRERGVVRVALSYGVIAWLLLQIADVVLEPLGIPPWVMTALIIAALAGFPISLGLAWFLEIGAQGVEVDTAAVGVPRPTARGLRRYADMIVIGVLVVAVAVLAVRQSDLGKPKPPENPAIAVLPFENLSGDPEQEYFSDGLAEEMLDRLGRVPGLRVISRASSFSFKGQSVDTRTVAEKLGVTTVLEGSVRRDGRRLRLNARLVDGASGQQAWSGSYDRELTDIFDVQAELAGAIVEAIIPAARGAVMQSPSPPTADLDAYDLYLAARTQVAIRTASSIRKAIELLERAVQLDPDFARVQALLASALLFERGYDGHGDLAVGRDPPQGDVLLRRAEAAVHRALALDPDLSEAHQAYATLLRDTGRPGAEQEYKRALELNPNNAAAWHDYGVFLTNVAHRPEESDAMMVRALQLDPRQPVSWANYLADILPKGREFFEQERARAIRTVGDMPGALSRFPAPMWASDRDGYREELEQAIRMFRDTPGALDEALLPGAAVDGFPVQVMEAGVEKQRRPADEDLPPWINYVRAWAAVDPARARGMLPEHGETRHGIDYDRVLPYLRVETTGLGGDWAAQDRAFADFAGRVGDTHPALNSVKAFWMTVRGRSSDAAQALAAAGDIPVGRPPPVLGNDRDLGFMDLVIVQVYRDTGRAKEAARRVDERLGLLRYERSRHAGRCQWDQRMLHAALAANEGLKDEAVEVLREAMNCGDVPYAFRPEFPWFRKLAGYPPYDALVVERARRIEESRAELLRIESEARLASTPSN
jgi:adenylate cyclase